MSDKPSQNQIEAQQIMTQNGFRHWKRREWVIWGAKHQACEECGAEPYSPCKHLTDVKKVKNGELAPGFEKINRQPHESRIDWARVLQGLYKRGYK